MTETLFSSVHLILSFSLSTINHFNFFCIGFSRREDVYKRQASWNVAQEPWLQNISNIINQFNLRASYGIQGNAVNSISPELILRMDEIKPYYGDYMSKISRIPNPHLSWERTKTWNFGLDVYKRQVLNNYLDLLL